MSRSPRAPFSPVPALWVCLFALLVTLSHLEKRVMKMHLRLDSKSLASRVSSVAYAILPTSPPPNPPHSSGTRIDDGDDADSIFYEKKRLHQKKSARHSRSTSLAAIGSSSSSRRSCRRISTLAAAAVLAGVGLLVVGGIAHHSRTASPDVRFDHRHRIAIDFETTEVPPEWGCNPFKEPGRLLSDEQNMVSFFLSSTAP